MTGCTPAEIRAKAPGRREFVARFDGRDITSDAGALLPMGVEERRSLLPRFAACLEDYKDPARVENTTRDLVAQRVLAFALEYEDVNDHQALRLGLLRASIVRKLDPKGCSRKRQRDAGLGLASPAALHRLELSHPGPAERSRYNRIALDQEAADQLLIALFIEAHAEAPEEVVLDLDVTDDRIHSYRVGRFYHGDYDHNCFLPLSIFGGDHLLCARLRSSE